jgi:small neutral amino acid transporter SnatA (MarC family)
MSVSCVGQTRSNVASLFTAASSVTVAQVRAAMPKNYSEEKRREVMKEFAVFQADAQTWQLRTGQP